LLTRRIAAESVKDPADSGGFRGHADDHSARLRTRNNQEIFMTRPGLWLAITLVGVGGLAGTFAACGGDNSTNVGAGDDSGADGTMLGDGPGGGDDTGLGDGGGTGDGSGNIVGDAGLAPDVFGGGGGSCLKLGSACIANGDCCSADCINHLCSYPPCTSDGLKCGVNGDCCSQSCVNGACAGLTSACKTLGNACGGPADCCSGNCVAGTCQASSFCGQLNEACSQATDCCSGVCTKSGTQALGTCGYPPGGGANCGMPDGLLCGGSGPDGGVVYVDGGLPRCGGGCCSRSCAPWGPTGVLVCQPASGCHPVGDLCVQDSDCCGSAGYPSQPNGGPVVCSVTNGIGICQNPSGCKPNGDVCRLNLMECNSSCDCCSGNCHQDTCKQDNVGVPRCSDAKCQNPGGACASSADCCNGSPCVPNPGGSPPFVCYGFQCVPSCGTCSNNADCCPGSSCTNGVCGPCGGSGDAGAPGDGGGVIIPDAGLPSDGAAPPPPDGGCAAYGQVCTVSSDCCNGVPCTAGRCYYLQ
jgi:hypothetical protein